MPEPELHVRDLTPPMPVVVCDSGRHVIHPGETCEDIDELQAFFSAYLDRELGAAFAAANQLSIVGNGMRGFLPIEPEREADPAERAFAVLEPHLHDVPLYRGGCQLPRLR